MLNGTTTSTFLHNYADFTIILDANYADFMFFYVFSQAKTLTLLAMKKTKQKSITLETIKAMKRGSREAEMELLGPGFHAKDHVHKSKKTYTRKLKHKPPFS